MPLSIQVPYRGDQYLFQGIAGAGAAIGQAGQALGERLQKKKDLAKAADYTVKAGGDGMLQQMGIHPGEWDTLSADDKIGAVHGMMASQANQEFVQKLKGQQAQSDLMQQQIAQYKQRAAEAQALEKFGQDYADGGGKDAFNAGNWAGGPEAGAESQASYNPSAQARAMYAMGKNPQAFAAPQFDNSLNSLDRLWAMGQQSGGVQFTQDPTTGHRFATFNKTIASSGIDPAKAAEANSKVTPFESEGVKGVTDAKGNVHIFKAPPPAKLSPILQTQVDSKKLMLSAIDGKIADMNAQILAAPAGENEKFGPNWALNPAQSLGEKLKDLATRKMKLQQELQDLQNATAAPAASGSKTNAAIPKWVAPGTNAPAGNVWDDYQRWSKGQ